MICPKSGIVCMNDICYGGSTLCGYEDGLERCRECKQLVPTYEISAMGYCEECCADVSDDCYKQGEE